MNPTFNVSTVIADAEPHAFLESITDTQPNIEILTSGPEHLCGQPAVGTTARLPIDFQGQTTTLKTRMIVAQRHGLLFFINTAYPEDADHADEIESDSDSAIGSFTILEP